MNEKEFHKLSVRKRRSFYVAEQLIDAIKSGAYQVGDRLPSERELAEAMGVSRTSVTEAVGALHIAGLIETKIGNGTFIGDAVRSKIDQGMGMLLNMGVDLLEIWKAKESLECMILHEVVACARKEDIQALSDILHAMRGFVKGCNCEKYLLSNVQFHLRIAEMSKNTLLRNAERSLLHLTQQLQLSSFACSEKSESMKTLLVRVYETHEAILRVIRGHDEKGIEAAVRNHFAESEALVQYTGEVGTRQTEWDRKTQTSARKLMFT